MIGLGDINSLIDWDKFTGKPIERTSEEQRSVDTILSIASHEVNQGQIMMFDPLNYFFVIQRPGVEKPELSSIALPRGIIDRIEEYRMLFGYKFLTKEQLMKFIEVEQIKIPDCFKTTHLNNREYNKGILI